MLNESLPGDALLAVYRDCRAADAAVRRLRDDGVDPDHIVVDDPADEVRSLDGEVREEMTQAFGHATVGVAYPKEAAKAVGTWGPVFVGVGAVIGALAALPFDLGGWDLWLRALVGAVVGATMGGAIGLVVLPAMGVRNPQEPSAAETGSIVRVEVVGEPVVRSLLATQPRRLDRLRHGAVIDTLATEDDLRPGGITEELVARFVREARAAPEDKTR